ncbi:MAG: acetylxylan esterase [Planctomycetes bacterium]|nr:acetylxylan esterase [Planctomycetota bacterium]MBL7043946.1 acetylxylan esterase [Pirellulaceae bacterium]
MSLTSARRMKNDRAIRCLRPMILTAFLAALALPATALDDSPDPATRPVHQVLTDRSPNLMLDYFRRLAATLPTEDRAPATIDAWAKRSQELREQLRDSLGNFPWEVRPPLNPRVTGTIDHGDHVVEKIVYESLRGLYVTALLYVPKRLDNPAPAVICVNGHWRPAKVERVIQLRCQGLAKMGVVAFCQDVIGTGERAAPPDAPHHDYHGNYRGAAPRIVDRSLLGYVMYECTRAMDYLETRSEVDAKRVMCTGASGGGKQSMFFPALDKRLAGGVPVCYVSNYQVHMGATACVGEIPTNVLRYTNQWEILGLHAPRPLLCINATRDIDVFQPKYMLDTLEKTRNRVYRLYGAQNKVANGIIDSGHAYNKAMRELLYNHVARHLLGQKAPDITEPDDLVIETAATLTCGLPPESETMQSFTYRRAGEMVAAIPKPADSDQWDEQKAKMLAILGKKIFGDSPDRNDAKRTRVRGFAWKGHRVEHWILETEPGLPVPVVLCLPGASRAIVKRPGVIIADEQGKQFAFERGLAEPLLAEGYAVLLIDYRGAGETTGTVPEYRGAHDFNLSNYSLFCGRPMTGMRVHDVRSAVDFLIERPDIDTSRIAYCGRGHAALVGVLATAFDDRIGAVLAEEILTTYVFEEELLDIGLCYLIPRILTVGDITHLVACVAPRPTLILNPVDGRRRMVSAEDSKEANQFARQVYGFRQSANRLQFARSDVKEVPARLVEWLDKTMTPVSGTIRLK